MSRFKSELKNINEVKESISYEFIFYKSELLNYLNQKTQVYNNV
ncbi:hypothetical protein [Mycoplasmopsis opalescens]|nr:hypothetical protein [Mycoplasmopsis opalescens]